VSPFQLFYPIFAKTLQKMDYQFTLRRFFVLVFLFVICPLVGWIAYAHRTNAPANIFEAGTDKPGEYSSNSTTIPDSKLDMSTPFYQNDAAEKLEKETGRPEASNAEDKYFKGEENENAGAVESQKKTETPVTPADSTKKENK
jgi:hypothetical protein